MNVVRTSRGGIDYLVGTLKKKTKTVTEAIFWKIPHDNPREDIRLKIGRYNIEDFDVEEVERENPKGLTLDYEEFLGLLDFIQQNYEPFRMGVREYIPINGESINYVKAVFNNPDKQKLLSFIAENNVLQEDLFNMLQYQKKANAIEEFGNMLEDDLLEQRWQEWFKENNWILSTEFVRILDESEIDKSNIADYLCKHMMVF